MTLDLNLAPAPDIWLWQLIVAPLFVALCTFLAGLAWAATAAVGRRLRSVANQVAVDCPIRLGWLGPAIAHDPARHILERSRLCCLLVRFGTDPYLTEKASAQERYDGRLINRAIEIDHRAGDTSLTLPLHRRLGVQIKFYYLVPEGEEAGDLWDALRKVRPASGKDHRIVLDEERPDGRKCWFRLAAYGAQETVDRYRNNYLGASRLRGFERSGRLRRPFWIRKEQLA